MNNIRARKLQSDIISMSSKYMSEQDETRYEKLNELFENELLLLPSEAKQVDNNGSLIYWSK